MLADRKNTEDPDALCPCGSGSRFEHCCRPFLRGLKYPETPEQLMRSRYVAYVLADLKYIENTTLPDMRKHYDFMQLLNWAESSEWLGLTVFSCTQDDAAQSGRVCFTARYRSGSDIVSHSEDSLFIRHEGRWYFSQGREFTPPKAQIPGRNDPCSCGSGKKYKKCCL